MLKLGCTLPNLANICLHKSNNEKFFRFCKIDRDLRQKIREDMTDGPSIVFSRKVVVEKFFIRDSANQSFEFMKASSIPVQCVKTCQHDCTQDGSFIPICKHSMLDITHLEALRIWWCLTTKKQSQNAELRASTHLEIKKNWLFQCRLILRSLQNCVWSTGMLLSFLPSQETRPSLSEKDIERGKNERDGWLETWVESQKRLQNQRDVGMWVVAKLQNERKK